MKNVLFLTSGLFYNPHDTTTREKFRALSAQFRGHIFGVVYEPENKHVSLDHFEVHGLLAPKFARGYGTFGGLYRLALYSIFVIFRALHLQYIRRDKIDAVIACDAFKTGLLAIIIGQLTGAKVGLDIVGNYVKAFQVNSPNPSGLEKLKQKFTLWMTPQIINRADGVKLLYEAQLEGFKTIRPNLKTVCFHDVVLLESFHPIRATTPYILIAGHPWYLKGVDVLLKSFAKLEKNHPDYRLKVVGYCPEPEPFFALAKGFHEKVDFFPNGVQYDQMIDLICNCSIFVLASRTEAMGRVLLEAMAAEKPVIASNVDGIPRVVIDGISGLLFESENIDDLSEKLNLLISNPILAESMGKAGFARVMNDFSQQRYAELFGEFVNSLDAPENK